jgi:hypothetical protein
MKIMTVKTLIKILMGYRNTSKMLRAMSKLMIKVKKMKML